VFEEDGSVVHCAAFESETERDQAVCTSIAGAAERVAPVPPAKSEETVSRRRGRPSRAPAIDAAVRALGRRLNRRKSIADQARQVLHQIAQSCHNPDLVPARTTVEIALRRKTRGKGRE
jgi:hypothetical protein